MQPRQERGTKRGSAGMVVLRDEGQPHARKNSGEVIEQVVFGERKQPRSRRTEQARSRSLRSAAPSPRLAGRSTGSPGRRWAGAPPNAPRRSPPRSDAPARRACRTRWHKRAGRRRWRPRPRRNRSGRAIGRGRCDPLHRRAWGQWGRFPEDTFEESHRRFWGVKQGPGKLYK